MFMFTGEDNEAYKKKEIIAGIYSCQHSESTWNIFVKQTGKHLIFSDFNVLKQTEMYLFKGA